MSNETKTRERFIILLLGFCYYCLGGSFLTSHDYTNIQLRYSSAIAPYILVYIHHNLIDRAMRHWTMSTPSPGLYLMLKEQTVDIMKDFRQKS
jgi:purine-cytosine permease-like protein